MAHLPGWDNLASSTAIHRFFEVGGIVVLAILVLFESVAYIYGHHKEALEAAAAQASRQAELESQKITFDADLAKAKLEAQRQIEALKTKQAPRRLSDAQRTAILEVVRNYPAQKFGVIYSNSAESDAQQFAKDFDDVLGTGWNRSKPLSFNNFVPSPVGVWICVNPAYAASGAITQPPAGARPLAQTLSRLGLYAENGNLYTMNNMEMGIIWIVIGSRPLALN